MNIAEPGNGCIWLNGDRKALVNELLRVSKDALINSARIFRDRHRSSMSHRPQCKPVFQRFDVTKSFRVQLCGSGFPEYRCAIC
jgi:hypothetical protein